MPGGEETVPILTRCVPPPRSGAGTTPMTTPTTTPGTRAPAPPDARRVRVAGAWATVAGYGGLFADRRVKLALQAARDFGEGRAPAAVLAHALIELARMTAE